MAKKQTFYAGATITFNSIKISNEIKEKKV